MTITASLLLLILALVCFILAAIPVTLMRVNLVALGLAFLTGFFLLGR